MIAFENDLIAAVAIGYMLKVLKSGKEINVCKTEFGHIRHGNYLDFVEMVGATIPTVVTYHNGIITVGNEIKKSEFDFALLVKSGPSLRNFFYRFQAEFGDIRDNDITDETYKKAVMFEIGLRMHANNYNLLEQRELLVDVIEKLCNYKNVNKQDLSSLHEGRKFLNMIKHFKNQFPSWELANLAFEKAYDTSVRLGFIAI